MEDGLANGVEQKDFGKT